MHKDLEKSVRENLVLTASVTEETQTYEDRGAEREAFRAEGTKKAKQAEREAASKGKTKGGGGKGSKGWGKGGGKGGAITTLQPSACLQDYVCCTVYACVH